MTETQTEKPMSAREVPNRHIVVIVTTYETYGGPDEATEQVKDSYSHYETPHFVYAAGSLDELPHPSQVQEISDALGS